MKIVQIIDSLELNGGSTMFLELVSGMRKHWSDCQIDAYVVSKTGKYGRRNLVDESLPVSYGIENLGLYSYSEFEDIQASFRDAVIFHHVLGYTKPLSFHHSCKYYIINHSLINLKRLPKFKANRYICVCRFFAQRVRTTTGLNSLVILNGCDDYYNTPPSINDDRFIIGRCQRVVPGKFVRDKIRSDFFANGYVQYIVGPINSGKNTKIKKKSKHDIFVGPVFDRQKKLSIIKSFDVYLHDAKYPEGASMAILEALSCGVPVIARDVGGGVRELIIHGRNGFLFKDSKELNNILKSLNTEKLLDIKRQVRDDFLSRFYIKSVLQKYKKLL